MPLNTYQTHKNEKLGTTKYWKGCGAMEPSSTTSGSINWQNLFAKTVSPVQVKVKFVLRTPGSIPAHDHHETCPKMFIVAEF